MLNVGLAGELLLAVGLAALPCAAGPLVVEASITAWIGGGRVEEAAAAPPALPVATAAAGDELLCAMLPVAGPAWLGSAWRAVAAAS